MIRELAFLLAAVRRYFVPDTLLPDSSLIQWDRLPDLAADHGVLPQLYLGLRDAEAPPEFIQRLKDRVEASLRSNLALAAQLQTILRAFEQGGVPVIPVKGPLLSLQLYGNAAFRTCEDLDLLVRPEHVDAARRVLTGLGYQESSPHHWPSAGAWRRAREAQHRFFSPSGNSPVDLHWTVCPIYFPTILSDSDVWDRAQTISFAGQPARVLSPEALLLYLAAHGAKHGWSFVTWICDLACLLKLEDKLDWGWVLARARSTRTSRILIVAILLASPLSDPDLPTEVNWFTSADLAAHKLVSEIWNRYHSPLLGSPRHRDLTRFLLKILESPRDRARLLFGLLVHPSEADFRVFKLPPVLFPLYYLLRPLRLTVRFCLGRTGRQAA